jgi:hypothetical protein
MRNLLIFFLIFNSALGWSVESAYRQIDTDYSFYEWRSLQQHSKPRLRGTTPIRSANFFSESLSIKRPQTWRSLPDLQQRFEKIRDERFLTVSGEPSLRRISWLYPQDGCWIRAALFNRNAFRLFVPIPDKIFAFGNLRVKTANSSRGVVSWWYHVAPIVSVGSEKYVLDPALEAGKPLVLKEWLARMGTPEKIKIAICGTGTYSPNDNCNKHTDGMELKASAAQKRYLQLERQELLKLGRNPEQELGETPPW